MAYLNDALVYDDVRSAVCLWYLWVGFELLSCLCLQVRGPSCVMKRACSVQYICDICTTHSYIGDTYLLKTSTSFPTYLDLDTYVSTYILASGIGLSLSICT